ncbi:MAG: hypothetical protein NXH85_00430 [Pseudomonadaceae bacterium]|nr:hypothetical protein [Pseudomonadaceae bacterium]
MALDRADIERLLALVNDELEKSDVTGEIYLVGGAVMCLAFNARASTKNLDAYFEPAKTIRDAATRIADRESYAADWLNDAVKGYLSPHGDYEPYLDLSNLKVFVARPEYLLAMKCLAMRLGGEFHDEDDVRFLLRYLNISSYQAAVESVTKYYPVEQFPQKALYALEEILEP